MCPTPPSSDEQRAFSRVSTHFRAYIRPLKDASSLPSFSGCPGCLSHVVDIDALKQASVPAVLAEYLGALNEKLDLIVSMLSQENILSDFPVEAEVVEISGSGMLFTSASSLAQDQYVEIVMMLSRMPLRMAGAVGKIARVQPHEQDGFLYGLDFTTIRDADLETVVQFVFQEQRARIREQKWV
jgi:hypothetical protein